MPCSNEEQGAYRGGHSHCSANGVRVTLVDSTTEAMILEFSGGEIHCVNTKINLSFRDEKKEKEFFWQSNNLFYRYAGTDITSRT